jgi:hypothetical protein
MAWAQAYPARPVRIIVGQTAGGATPFFGGLSEASLDLLPSNRELCRRLRHAYNRIAELADPSRDSMTPIRVRHVG